MFSGVLCGEVGVKYVKRRRLIFVLFLVGAAIGVSTVPLEDLPETSFNEVDAPVNLAPPVQPRLKFVPPACDSDVIPGLSACVVSSWVLEPAAVTSGRHPHSLQDLLCTFLI
jgi:hypothetical protein